MKTIEEAARDFLGLNESNPNYIHTIKDEFELSIFKAGAEFAQRWISVEDELPPLGVPVICKYNVFGKEYYWSGTFYTKERVMHFIKKHLKITHWRPILVK